MKRLLVLIMVAALLCAFAFGCSAKPQEAAASAEPATEEAPAAAEPAAEEAPAAEEPEAEEPAAADGEKLKIGFANLTDAGDYMVWVKKGMQTAADEAGVELICVDNEGDPAKAVENADTLINAGVDAVIEYMNNSDINKQIKDMLDEAGIPCVAVDIPVVNDNGAAAYMGGDNYKAGFICGENLGQAALDTWDGQVDLFISVETMSNGETNTLRNGGILDGIRSKVDVPDDKVVHVDAKDSTSEAQKVVTDALTANQGAQHILIGCHQDDETQGAFAAVEIANRQDQVLLSGCGPFGGTFENLRKPEANFWIGSASFSPEQYGPVAIPIAIALAKGEDVPAESFVTHYFLTHDNINEYYPED